MTGDIWARVGPLLEPALAHAGWSYGLSEVRRAIEAGDAQLWGGARSAVVTVIEDQPRERRLLFWLAGGELDEIVQQLIPAAERWGRDRGCRRAIIVGRPGWERALKPKGYAPIARLIAKDL